MKKVQTKDLETEKGNQPTDNLTENNTAEGIITEKSADEMQLNEVSDSDFKAENDETQLGSKEKEENKIEKPDYESMILDLKDKYIRLSAEFDNYRKRTLKEKIELTKYAGEDILKNFFLLLTILNVD